MVAMSTSFFSEHLLAAGTDGTRERRLRVQKFVLDTSSLCEYRYSIRLVGTGGLNRTEPIEKGDPGDWALSIGKVPYTCLDEMVVPYLCLEGV